MQKKIAKKQAPVIEPKPFTPVYQPTVQTQQQQNFDSTETNYFDQTDNFSRYIEDEQDVFAINFENGFGCEFQDFAF